MSEAIPAEQTAAGEEPESNKEDLNRRAKS